MGERTVRVRVEAVAGDGRPESCGGGVELADQLGRAAQGMAGPGIGREPVTMPGLPARVIGDVAVDIGPHFPLPLDPQYPWRALKPGCLQMTQILMHRRRPRPHRTQQPTAAPHDPAGHPPARKPNLTRSRRPVTGHRPSITRTSRMTSLEGAPRTAVVWRWPAHSGTRW